ncbi:hypothetical protein ACCQ13_14945 [Xanthomonas sp. NCPPB 1638]|uniref:hypothetical protein n=1 Tax=Xanthomonas TaxID=338 RepID=UPI00132EE04C|nr:hypothetical protein [Xanthomonas cucurbitae]QHG87979.1 hypothetical protein EBN15_14580 [Xanthomonas cucurbitae]
MFDLIAAEDPVDVMNRACNVLAATGHPKLADRLVQARERVERVVDAAGQGTEEAGDRAVSVGLWFGPQRATQLREALAPFAASGDHQAKPAGEVRNG